ncbi:uncharacterized protein LOC119550570 [Drosophila subpulchrella]|uniref:uncharacterized protein LOC119550570 n=1 Tax=Drosophila subpulchrella TaxID=1486046 RepID=UPI0018A15ECD|nr:uncharacterized protein LOC119550570 [Drosophila subpulchrella]
MDESTAITIIDYEDLEGNVTIAAIKTTTYTPATTIGLWGLLFVFVIIILFIALCCTCMGLLVLFGCIKSFLCFRCRRRDEQ